MLGWVGLSHVPVPGEELGLDEVRLGKFRLCLVM
jgi:hypothetical protein